MMETTLVRLPIRLSDVVDEIVEHFVERHQGERLQARRRYHGADLWIAYAHEPVGESEPAFLSRRLTVGVYSDDPDRLRFIPDIIVTRPQGRFTLALQASDGNLRWDVDAISGLQARLVSNGAGAPGEFDDPHRVGSIASALERA